ncbi:chloride channel protein CLC-f-like [Arachis duranensis]|uniref:Chloride channel protein CLC-f-like n=1 Tax=Arachis duranensis TaxID=130453 RepID=A0A9C6TNH1_ARADU|nr:chloride channel protein CLC-f-like [Arachis duranensis]
MQRFEIVNGVTEVEGIAEEKTTEKGVPGFWLNAMKNNEVLAEEVRAVGLAIWVPSVTNRKKEIDNKFDTRNSPKGYSLVSPADENEGNWRQANAADGLELSVVSDAADHEAIDKKLHLKNLKVSQAMSGSYLKVSSSATLKDAIQCIHDGHQNCVLVVGQEGFLEGILTYGDIEGVFPRSLENTCLVSSVCTRGMTYRGRERGLLTCYPNTSLDVAKKLMEAKGIKQLPVVKRGGDCNRERKRRIAGLLHYDAL